MDTPTKPAFNARANRSANTSRAPNITAKTPFQAANLLQRTFKSEHQSRVSSRICNDSNYVRTNVRNYPTSQCRPNLDFTTNKTSTNTSSTNRSLIRSKLNLLTKSQPRPVIKIAEEKNEEVKPSFTNATKQYQPSTGTFKTPVASRIIKPLPSKTPLQTRIHDIIKCRQNPQTNLNTEEKKEGPALTSRTNHITTQHTPYQPQQLTPHKQQLRLVQDTRGYNAQPAGPLATSTKAPLSVSQYTQPTPSSKTAQQIPRAHSEPSIKYQVKVNDKTYKVLRKLGTGGSAKVYEGFEPSTYQTVAIKIINVARADPKAQESYFNEQSILMKLQDSRHVARIYNSEYKADCKELVIVMEKGDADLSQVIDSHFKLRDKMIDGIFIKFYWRGMVSAVVDIHRRGIIHADLKPVNFILVKNEIKLIDFGIANVIDPGGTSIIRDYQIGTVNYMAPEALRNRANDLSFAHLTDGGDENSNQVKRTIIKYDKKVDIWSLGCILYNLVYGRPPFDKYQDLISKVQAIINPRHVIEFPQISNLNLLDCMRSCLRYNAAERPSAEDLLNHPYLKEDIVVLARQDCSQ